MTAHVSRRPHPAKRQDSASARTKCLGSDVISASLDTGDIDYSHLGNAEVRSPSISEKIVPLTFFTTFCFAWSKFLGHSLLEEMH